MNQKRVRGKGNQNEERRQNKLIKLKQLTEKYWEKWLLLDAFRRKKNLINEKERRTEEQRKVEKGKETKSKLKSWIKLRKPKWVHSLRVCDGGRKIPRK